MDTGVPIGPDEALYAEKLVKLWRVDARRARNTHRSYVLAETGQDAIDLHVNEYGFGVVDDGADERTVHEIGEMVMPVGKSGDGSIQPRFLKDDERHRILAQPPVTVQ